jgi:hypothetical protein
MHSAGTSEKKNGNCLFDFQNMDYDYDESDQVYLVIRHKFAVIFLLVLGVLLLIGVFPSCCYPLLLRQRVAKEERKQE